MFAVLRYDNLKAAVKKILRGYQREETARFIAFRSHWRFSSEFCSPYEAHEKGGIEGEAGYIRRNHSSWREQGLWPQSYDRLLDELIRRHGKQSGTRPMIQVLSLIKAHGHQRVRTAVEEAVSFGCADAAAVRHLVEAANLAHARNAIIELDTLSRFERPLPVISDYDRLLDQEMAP